MEIFAPCRSFLARAGAFLLRRGHAATFWLRLRRAALFLACVLVAVAIPSAAGPIRFRDATKSSGIGFVHTDGSSGKRYIVETVASGLGLIDFDNDGDLDIYFLNGAPLPGTPPPPRPPSNELYRNNGDGTFTDVTAPSGTGDSGYALGCAVADYDNDGHDDIFLTNYGGHRLLHNNGHGAFTDVTERAGLRSASTGADCVGAGCAFLDYDRDGYLDLYIGNYLRFDAAQFKPCARANVPVYCDPRTYAPLGGRLFHNQGNGTFDDVSESSGIGRHKGYTMGIVCSDFDSDGWTDIYVGNDVQENFLFRNRGDGTFQEIGVLAGVAYDQYGDEQGTMGANAGDYDGDGRFDIIVTDYQNQVNTLYRNLGVIRGNLLFQDVTVATGIGAGSLPLVTWGCGWADFDLDGVREVFIAAGHLQDTVEQYDSSSSYKQRNLLFQWRSGRYTDITAQGGEALQVVESSRGSVFGDLNNDGRMDIVVLNARTHPTLMMNETFSTHHWIILKLVGTRSNRSAVGTVARLAAGGRIQVDEVRAGRGYQSAEDLRLHFGLGAHAVIDRLELRWPSGLTEVRTNLNADRVLRLTEGETVPAKR
ncbi:MAG: CRTAC1 family protein [Verrucomicrobiota bacterium]